MSTRPEPEPVTNPHHRQTLIQLFEHPTSHNIEWHAVLSLLEAVGSVELRHDGEYAVSVGAETQFLGRPRVKTWISNRFSPFAGCCPRPDIVPSPIRRRPTATRCDRGPPLIHS
jgi:hypothetical protein